MIGLTGIDMNQRGIWRDAEYVDSVAIMSNQHHPEESVTSSTHLFVSQHTASGCKSCLEFCSWVERVNVPHIYVVLPCYLSLAADAELVKGLEHTAPAMPATCRCSRDET